MTHEAIMWVCSLFYRSRYVDQLFHGRISDLSDHCGKFVFGLLPVLQIDKKEKSPLRAFFVCILSTFY